MPTPGRRRRCRRALVARAVADGLDLLTVAGRFDCPTRAVALAAPGAADDARLPRRRRPARSAPGPVHRPDGQRPVHGWSAAARSSTPAAPARRPPHRRGRRPRAGDGDGRVRRRRSSTRPTLLTVRMYESARRGLAGLGAVVVAARRRRRCRGGSASWRSSRWPRRCRWSGWWRVAADAPRRGPRSRSASARSSATAPSYRPRGRGVLALADRRRRRRRRPGPRHAHPPPGLARPHVPLTIRGLRCEVLRPRNLRRKPRISNGGRPARSGARRTS